MTWGETAGQVQPITGEGMGYGLWPAGLVAEAFGDGDPQAYEGLWRELHGVGFLAASEMLGPLDQELGACGIVFQVAMALALSVPA